MHTQHLVVAAVLFVGCAGTGHNTAPRVATTEQPALAQGEHTPAPRATPEPTAPPEPPPPLARWTATLSHHHTLLLGMRLTEVWLWPEPFAETRPSVVVPRYQTAFTHAPKWNSDARWFQWDGDRWFINVIGHAALGSELYLGARRCNFSPLASVALTALSSAAWEYGYEASGVRPSALDLVYTPLSGMVTGELRYWLLQKARSVSSPNWRTLVTVLVDPFGELERRVGFPC